MDLRVDLFTAGHRYPSSQGVVSEILSGKRDLNVRQITQLAARFGVSPALFMPVSKNPANAFHPRTERGGQEPFVGTDPQGALRKWFLTPFQPWHHFLPGSNRDSAPHPPLTDISIRDIFTCAYYHAEAPRRLRACPSGRASVAAALVHDCA